MSQNKKPPAMSSNVREKIAANVSPFAARRAMPLPSPFAKTESSTVDPDTLSDDAAYYRLNARTGTLAASEIDADARAVEVQVLWGEYDALHLSMLAPARDFVIGEDGADFAMERAQLGTDRYPLTVVEGGATFVTIPFDAEVTVRNRGTERKLTALREEGALTATHEGSMRYRLADDDVVRIRRAGFVFQVKSIAAPKKIAAASRFDFTPAYYMGGAATVISALMLALSLANPSSGTLTRSDIDTSSRLVQSIINPVEDVRDDVRASTSQDSAAADDGQRASDAEGLAGRPNRPVSQRRQMNNGAVQPTTPAAASDAVRNNEVLGTIASMTSSLLSNSSPYTAGAAVGSDPMAQLGAIAGMPGDGGGFGGLGTRSHGLGGGNTLEGILAGPIGTIGDRPGNGPGGPGGPGQRPGRGPGDDLGQREGVHPAQVIPDGTGTVTGGLAQEVIRRTIQRNIGQVRFCYEQALNANPNLAGRVTVRFVISPSGAVQTAVASSSTVADPRVGVCVAQAMRRLSFPAPDGGGVVSVTYPFMFSANH